MPEESLDELARPERLVEIRRKAADAGKKAAGSRALLDVLAGDDEDGDQACMICAL